MTFPDGETKDRFPSRRSGRLLISGRRQGSSIPCPPLPANKAGLPLLVLASSLEGRPIEAHRQASARRRSDSYLGGFGASPAATARHRRAAIRTTKGSIRWRARWPTIRPFRSAGCAHDVHRHERSARPHRLRAGASSCERPRPAGRSCNWRSSPVCARRGRWFPFRCRAWPDRNAIDRAREDRRTSARRRAVRPGNEVAHGLSRNRVGRSHLGASCERCQGRGVLTEAEADAKPGCPLSLDFMFPVGPAVLAPDRSGEKRSWRTQNPRRPARQRAKSGRADAGSVRLQAGDLSVFGSHDRGGSRHLLGRSSAASA